jgi:hypothetical protein
VQASSQKGSACVCVGGGGRRGRGGGAAAGAEGPRQHGVLLTADVRTRSVAGDHAPGPLLFRARTLNWYSVRDLRPDTV